MLLYNAPINRCSTGFGVRVQQVGGGGQYGVLSAAHCVPTYYTSHPWYNGQRNDSTATGGVLMSGSAGSFTLGQYDSLFIETSSSGFGMYTGSWNSTTSATVAGAMTTSLDSFVRTSGSNSGEHPSNLNAGHDVISITFDRPCPGNSNFYCTDGVVAEHPGINKEAAAANHDSGGPVFSYSPDPAYVYARGIISEGWLNTNLGCTRRFTDGSCFWKYVYQPIVPILQARGLSLNVG
jgi:hypothetical protein